MQSMKYIWLTESNQLSNISQYIPFKVLISIDDPVNTSRQKEISGWLVKMGAMHVTIRGEDCMSWNICRFFQVVGNKRTRFSRINS